jgi:hypothetical protein
MQSLLSSIPQWEVDNGLAYIVFDQPLMEVLQGHADAVAAARDNKKV